MALPAHGSALLHSSLRSQRSSWSSPPESLATRHLPEILPPPRSGSHGGSAFPIYRLSSATFGLSSIRGRRHSLGASGSCRNGGRREVPQSGGQTAWEFGRESLCSSPLRGWS